MVPTYSLEYTDGEGIGSFPFEVPPMIRDRLYIGMKTYMVAERVFMDGLLTLIVVDD